MAAPHTLGRAGEDLAARYLESRGWRILDRNWRFHHKELDLVAVRDGVVAFIEVKARSAGALGHPLDAITAAKRRDLTTAARGWIARKGRPSWSYRFDAVVVVRGRGATKVRHLEGAWTQ